MSVKTRGRGEDDEMGSVQPGSLYPVEEAAGRQTPPGALLQSKIQPFSFFFLKFTYPKHTSMEISSFQDPSMGTKTPCSCLPEATQSQHMGLTGRGCLSQ